MLGYSTFIGGPTCTCTPINRSAGRFGTSSSPDEACQQNASAEVGRPDKRLLCRDGRGLERALCELPESPNTAYRPCARVASLWLAAVSIGASSGFCVGSGMLIRVSTARPLRPPAIANQSIPPFDRPRVPCFWCQVLKRVVIRSGRRSKYRGLARFHTDGRGDANVRPSSPTGPPQRSHVCF